MQSDLTQKQLDDLKVFIEKEQLKVISGKFLNKGHAYSGKFDKVWTGASIEDKKTLLSIVKESHERGQRGEYSKDVFNDLIQEQITKKLSGEPSMDTRIGGKQQSEKGSGMSKYDEDTKEQLQEAVDGLSPSGKKIIKTEQIVTDRDVNNVVDKMEKLSAQDLKIIAQAFQIDSQNPKQIQQEIVQQLKTGSAKTEVPRISKTFDEYKKTHPKTVQKIRDIAAGFQDTFRTVPQGISVDPIWFKINRRREKIYDRVKTIEKQQMLTQTENNKLLYKEVTRNGGQSGADLAVIENQHGIEEYRVKYPSIDQMLNSKLIDQYAFDLAQRRHLTFVQTNLLNDILKAGGSVVVPNIEFLRESYTEKLQRGEDYSAEFKKYQDAITKQIGSQVAYNGEQNWQNDVGKASKNMAAPAMQQPLQKPKMLPVKDVLLGIEQIADYISQLSGNLNHLQLDSYKKVDDVFANTVVQKKEPTTFKPQAGMAFKLRELMC